MKARAVIEEEVAKIVLLNYQPKLMGKILPFVKEVSARAKFQQSYLDATGHVISQPNVILDLQPEETFLIKSLADYIEKHCNEKEQTN